MKNTNLIDDKLWKKALRLTEKAIPEEELCEATPIDLTHYLQQQFKNNLPPQISREAVKELREEWENEKSNMADNESDYNRMGEFIKNLDILLPQQQDE